MNIIPPVRCSRGTLKCNQCLITALSCILRGVCVDCFLIPTALTVEPQMIKLLKKGNTVCVMCFTFSHWCDCISNVYLTILNNQVFFFYFFFFFGVEHNIIFCTIFSSINTLKLLNILVCCIPKLQQCQHRRKKKQ